MPSILYKLKVYIRNNTTLSIYIVDVSYRPLASNEVFPFLELASAAVNTCVHQDWEEFEKNHKEKYMASMARRIDHQFRALIRQSVRHVILSAFGCGAFLGKSWPRFRQREVKRAVAQLFKQAIYKFGIHFEVICFAIYDGARLGRDTGSDATSMIFHEVFSKQDQQLNELSLPNATTEEWASPVLQNIGGGGADAGEPSSAHPPRAPAAKQQSARFFEATHAACRHDEAAGVIHLDLAGEMFQIPVPPTLAANFSRRALVQLALDFCKTEAIPTINPDQPDWRIHHIIADGMLTALRGSTFNVEGKTTVVLRNSCPPVVWEVGDLGKFLVACTDDQGDEDEWVNHFFCTSKILSISKDEQHTQVITKNTIYQCNCTTVETVHMSASDFDKRQNICRSAIREITHQGSWRTPLNPLYWLRPRTKQKLVPQLSNLATQRRYIISLGASGAKLEHQVIWSWKQRRC